VDKVYSDTSAVLNDAETRAFLANEGLAAAVQNPAQFGSYMAAETKSAARLVAEAGLEKQ
jgi:tripartite-type tricarboxylate transporter receptor subunit TctC